MITAYLYDRSQLRLSKVQAHSFLCISEQYHNPLLFVNRKIKCAHPTLTELFGLSLAVKSMSSKMGEVFLLFSRLVFGIVHCFPIFSIDVLEQDERMEALKVAQSEMNSIIAEREVKTALTRKLTLAADQYYETGDEVLVQSDNRKKWIRLLIAINKELQMMTLLTLDGKRKKNFTSF